MKFCVFTVASIGILAAAMVQADELRERQSAECTGDALRLCSNYIPDEDQIEACLNAKRAELSPGCGVFFRDDSAAENAPAARGITKGQKVAR